ncbi:MAG: hypothetical protein M1835_005838 [Candelina submexicana]|nr:MAG: hypothetical protein M1835_005838 [Candelina submexicana]
MSFIRQFSAKPSLQSPFTVTAYRAQPIAYRSNFHSSSTRQVLNEGNHDEDDRGDHAEHHKQDQLRKQKEGKGHWKHELASNSEAAVKADREELHASDENIAQMQKETEDAAKRSRADEK